MKKISVVFICVLMLLSGCKPASRQTSSPEAGQTTPALSSSEDLLYGDGYNTNLLTGVDEFGRTVPPVLKRLDKREVGIFYWLWHGTTGSDQVYDSSKILAMENGLDILLYQDTPISPVGKNHYWGEPLFGYYNSSDEYVIRKHMELLTYAGVDFLVFDTSNTITYKNVYQKIMKVICEMREEGWDAPQVTFYTHTCSIDTIKKLYKETYSKGLYQEAWYRIDGKPLMIGFTDVEYDKNRTHSQFGFLSDYNPTPLGDEIMNFFYFRRTAWVGCDPVTKDGWPWIEQTYPQNKYGNLMCVGVASHKGYYFCTSLTGGAENWGRGWSFKTNDNDTTRALQGSFFQEEWDTVFKKNPEIAFISGWNEWYCGKTYVDAIKMYAVGDSVNMEFSRDAEMMKGGYNDAFLVQMAQNIRKYKYEPFTQTTTAQPQTIDITKDAAQWDTVKAVYKRISKTGYWRDYRGTVMSLRYKVPVPKNNIQEVKVSGDTENIYFYIRCENAITPIQGTNWMNLFIGTGTPSQKGWNSYEYVLNRSINGSVSDIEKLSDDFTGTKTGEAQINITDNIMQVCIPRTALGLTGNDNTFYFKVADSVETPKDIMDYYVSGCCMPMGRFSYQYFG